MASTTVSFSGSLVTVPVGTPPRKGLVLPTVVVPGAPGYVVPGVVVPGGRDVWVGLAGSVAGCCASAGAAVSDKAISNGSEGALTKVPFPSAGGLDRKGADWKRTGSRAG